ncbi:MAG: histidine phosphatase family protein [Anaerolineaceae bacterium]|nr:histidine phosphatase family protein [Anaerolineaceae bacterium]
MMKETVIHTLRHAHTAYNEQKRYAGSIDVPLNENGVRDSLEAARALTDHHFDVVVTSKLRRAIETAKLLVDGATPIIESELCNERRFGVLEGLTWEDVRHLDPPVMLIEVGNDLHTVNPQGGEPFEDVWFRAKQFRVYLFSQFPGSDILVVSHGVFLQMFHGVLSGLNCIESLAHYPSNLELHSFFFAGQELTAEKVTRLNQTEHPRW